MKHTILLIGTLLVAAVLFSGCMGSGESDKQADNENQDSGGDMPADPMGYPWDGGDMGPPPDGGGLGGP